MLRACRIAHVKALHAEVGNPVFPQLVRQWSSPVCVRPSGSGITVGAPKELAAEVLASIAAREAVSRRVIERGTIVDRSALLGESPLTQRLRFLFEMPIANLFDFLL